MPAMVISRAFWTALKIVGCRMSSVCHPSPGSVSQMKSSGTQGMNRLRRIGVGNSTNRAVPCVPAASCPLPTVSELLASS